MPENLPEPGVCAEELRIGLFAELEAMSERMWFGNDADDAHRFVLGLMGWMLEGLDDAGRAGAIDALRTTMAAHETSEGVFFESAAWIVQATRP
jgi:hypothetical protein